MNEFKLKFDVKFIRCTHVSYYLLFEQFMCAYVERVHELLEFLISCDSKHKHFVYLNIVILTTQF